MRSETEKRITVIKNAIAFIVLYFLKLNIIVVLTSKGGLFAGKNVIKRGKTHYYPFFICFYPYIIQIMPTFAAVFNPSNTH